MASVSWGASTAVVDWGLQRAGRSAVAVPAAHSGSPPPVAVAWLLTDWPLTAFCAVTPMVKLVLAPLAKPAAAVQISVWLPAGACVHAAGRLAVSMVRPAGMVSVTTAASVVAAVPVLLKVSTYWAGTPTVKAPTELCLVKLSCGAVTGLSVVPLQCASAGQLGSPVLASACAVLTRLWPMALGWGVTGIVKLTAPPVATPAGTWQVTVWPAAVQAAGRLPMAKPAGISSVMVPAKVGAWPLLVAVITYWLATPTTNGLLRVLTTSSRGMLTLVLTVLWQPVVQLAPPPETVAELLTKADVPLATLTGALMTGALEPGSSTALLVQASWLDELALQSQPVAVTGRLMLTPAGIVSLTVMGPTVLLVPLLPTRIE